MPKSRKCVNVLKARNSRGAQELRDRIDEVEKLVCFQIKKYGLKGLADAEDMKQQAIMRCFAMSHNYDPDEISISTYVCKVTQQSMFERLRYRNTKMRGLFNEISTETVLEGHEDITIGDTLECDGIYDEIEDEMFMNAVKPRIIEAVNTKRVQNAERDVNMFIDHYVYDMTYVEIAKKYGLNGHRAVDCALQRIKKRLAEVSEDVFE